jgi:hypothetical protein
MGCDIHPVIEVYEDGDWTAVQSERFQDYEDRPFPISVLGGRNYHRFSLLADVRNHYLEHKVAALFPQRGLPADCSEQSSDELREDGDIHSITYFTLRELIDVDWDSDATSTFQVGIFGDTYQYYLEHKRLPPDWEEDWGGERRNVEAGEMQLLLISGNGLPTTAPGEQPYLKGRLVKSGPVVTVSCPISYRQIDPWLKNDLIPALQEMGDPDKVRVVIGFDN